MMRRIAVHFCPALLVISRTTSLRYRSNSGVPGTASGPRMDALSESVSAVNATDSPITRGCCCNFSAVHLEPVNAIVSWQFRWSNKSPTPPQISCRLPGGRSPDSMIDLTTSSVRYAVLEAGLTIAGTPAARVGASFSSMPHTGKLNALIWTAAPSFGV